MNQSSEMQKKQRNKKAIVFSFLFLLLFSCHTEKKPVNNGPNQAEKTYTIAQLTTVFGEIDIWLFDKTPAHRDNFVKLANEGFFNGTTFHRVIKNFVIQGGDPLTKDMDPSNDGQGGPGYTIPAEIIPEIKHDYGMVGAARESDQVNPERRSSGSQFYIVQNPYGAHHLDGAYTVFGKVIKGMDVVEQIAQQPTDKRDRPLVNVTIQNVQILKLTSSEIKARFGVDIESLLQL